MGVILVAKKSSITYVNYETRWVAQHYFTLSDGSTTQKSKSYSKKKYNSLKDVQLEAPLWVKKEQQKIDSQIIYNESSLTFGMFVETVWRPHYTQLENASDGVVRYNTTLSNDLVMQNIWYQPLSKLTLSFGKIFYKKYCNTLLTHKIRHIEYYPTKASLNNVKRAINHVIDYAVEQEFINNNNFKQITNINQFLRKDTRKTTTNSIESRNSFTTNELLTIIETVELKDPSFARAISLMSQTGLRTEELASLTINNSINFRDNFLRIDSAAGYNQVKGLYIKTTTKTDKPRNVYFNSNVFALIITQINFILNSQKKLDLQEHQIFLFPKTITSNVMWAPKNISVYFSSFINNIPDVPHYNMYSLRHTYATQMVSAGMKYPAIAQQLGHSLKTFLTYYVHPLKDDIQSVGDYDFLKKESGNTSD